MKVKELIKELERMNPEADVVLASDAEGNEMSFLDECVDEENQVTLWPE